MDAERLRTIYNSRFQGGENRWSSTDIRKTIKVAYNLKGWLKQCGYQKRGGQLLDVGCATGYYTEALRIAGFTCTGLDYSEIAVAQAQKNFPECTFVHMNGFEPSFDTQFDVIFCKGFSGANTHDINFIASWVNKYMKFISPGGFFVLSFTTNFSGNEKENETVNHTLEELKRLTTLVDGNHKGTFYFHYFGWLSSIKKKIERSLFKKNVKENYFILFQKQ
jgi:2-polyprenyl-3-methyl-5-hydroxy-6-metoxy-1,4-benzoquinol methylase